MVCNHLLICWACVYFRLNIHTQRVSLNYFLGVMFAFRILTWEDAYYDNPNICDSSGNESCQNTWEQIGSADFSHDPLELAVAKMSYHVYSLGEGYDLTNEYVGYLRLK